MHIHARIAPGSRACSIHAHAHIRTYATQVTQPHIFYGGTYKDTSVAYTCYVVTQARGTPSPPLPPSSAAVQELVVQPPPPPAPTPHVQPQQPTPPEGTSTPVPPPLASPPQHVPQPPPAPPQAVPAGASAEPIVAHSVIDLGHGSGHVPKYTMQQLLDAEQAWQQKRPELARHGHVHKVWGQWKYSWHTGGRVFMTVGLLTVLGVAG